MVDRQQGQQGTAAGGHGFSCFPYRLLDCGTGSSRNNTARSTSFTEGLRSRADLGTSLTMIFAGNRDAGAEPNRSCALTNGFVVGQSVGVSPRWRRVHDQALRHALDHAASRNRQGLAVASSVHLQLDHGVVFAARARQRLEFAQRRHVEAETAPCWNSTDAAALPPGRRLLQHGDLALAVSSAQHLALHRLAGAPERRHRHLASLDGGVHHGLLRRWGTMVSSF